MNQETRLWFLLVQLGVYVCAVLIIIGETVGFGVSAYFLSSLSDYQALTKVVFSYPLGMLLLGLFADLIALFIIFASYKRHKKMVMLALALCSAMLIGQVVLLIEASSAISDLTASCSQGWQQLTSIQQSHLESISGCCGWNSPCVAPAPPIPAMCAEVIPSILDSDLSWVTGISLALLFAQGPLVFILIARLRFLDSAAEYEESAPSVEMSSFLTEDADDF